MTEDELKEIEERYRGASRPVYVYEGETIPAEMIAQQDIARLVAEVRRLREWGARAVVAMKLASDLLAE